MDVFFSPHCYHNIKELSLLLMECAVWIISIFQQLSCFCQDEQLLARCLFSPENGEMIPRPARVGFVLLSLRLCGWDSSPSLSPPEQITIHMWVKCSRLTETIRTQAFLPLTAFIYRHLPSILSSWATFLVHVALSAPASESETRLQSCFNVHQSSNQTLQKNGGVDE